MKKFHINRLVKLYHHINNGKLGHKKFDFSVINEDVDIDYGDMCVELNTCGTNGCAMGELPILFPKYWEFHNSGIRYKINNEVTSETEYKMFQYFFGITEHEEQHLFVPYGQSPEDYGGKSLSGSASRKEVALP